MEKGLGYGAFAVYLCAGVFIGIAHWTLNPTPSVPWSILTGAIGFLMVLLIHDNFARSAHQDTLIQMIDRFSEGHQAILTKITHLESQLTARHDHPPPQDLKAEMRVMAALLEKLSRFEQSGRDISQGQTGQSHGAPAPSKINKINQNDVNNPRLLSDLKQAISQDRVDMLVQPIVSLPQRKTRHFECFSRLRTDDDHLILPDDFLKIAAGHSLIRLIDNMLLFKCAALTRRLLAKKFNVLFFCNISHETLMDHEFLDGFMDFINGNSPLIPHLIFELDDYHLKTNGDNLFPILKKLAEQGCHFSVDVTSFDGLDMDLLARHQFKFIKVTAKMMIDNPNAQGFKAEVDKNAMDIILTQIEDEQTLVQCQDFQGDFGQGYLFGKPRLVTA